jgi:hypothetical protein
MLRFHPSLELLSGGTRKRLREPVESLPLSNEGIL